MKDNYSLMPQDKEGKDIIEGLKTDRKMIEAVTKKKEQKGSGDPYLDLQRDQFEYAKKRNAEADLAAQESAMTQGIMGGMQSGIQTAFGSQSQEQALGGALTTGLQVGMATGNPWIGAAAGAASLLFGSQSAKKAEAQAAEEEAKKEKLRKLENMRTALSGYSSAKASAMQNLMNVLR